jgi:hypothetical protein
MKTYEKIMLAALIVAAPRMSPLAAGIFEIAFGVFGLMFLYIETRGE